MIRLVSAERAKHWLGFIHDDERIDFAILGASRAVIDYLGVEDDIYLGLGDEQEFDSDGSPIGVPEVEQIATAILVGKLLDGMDPKDIEYGRLPVEVTSMLYIRRRQLGVA